jgi:hypothetical protein
MEIQFYYHSTIKQLILFSNKEIMLSFYLLMNQMLVMLLLKLLPQLLVHSKTGILNLINNFRIKFSYSKPNDGSGLFHRLAEYIGASTTTIPNVMLYD